MVGNPFNSPGCSELASEAWKKCCTKRALVLDETPGCAFTHSPTCSPSSFNNSRFGICLGPPESPYLIAFTLEQKVEAVAQPFYCEHRRDENGKYRICAGWQAKYGKNNT